MKTIKKILAFSISLVILLACMPAIPVFAETYSGTCGDNVTWSLDTESGVLTISGSGSMMNDGDLDFPPWSSQSLNIESVNIENGVTSIGDYAFSGCHTLTSVTIPDSVTNIGYGAFSYCLSLTSITIPDSVTSIGSYAFSDCFSLTSITIPDSVTSIGEDTFSYCSNLTSITIPYSVTSIGEDAFSHCSSLTSVTIPDSVTSIGRRAFSDCSSLTSVTIPDSVTSIGSRAFSDCSSLTAINVDADNKIYSSNDGVLFNKDKTELLCFPAGISGKYVMPNGVTSIGDYAFYYCSRLTSITIPYGVTSIGNSTFDRCSSLANITIPDSVTSIGSYAFESCSSLTSITIPDSVTSIGKYMFSHCSSLTSITIPDSVTSIGDRAFYGCSSLTSITIPDSVTRIGEDAFFNTDYYNNSDNWENDVLYIGNHLIDVKKSIWGGYSIKSGTFNLSDYAFSNCTGLTSITIPDSVTSIGYRAFEDCSSLTSITIPDSVTSIGDWAFYGCSSLTSITIPDSVTSIGESAFYYCAALETVYYCGTEADWNEISISSYNNSLTNATRIYHNYSSTTTPPTCTENGYTTYTCSICGNNYTDEHSALGHNYSEEFTIDKEATDFETGIKSRHCSRCDSVTEVTVIPKTLIASGNCGENALWAVGKNGTLIISGSGTVKNYGTYASVPWYIYSADIISVEIGEEITAVGHYAFNSLKNLKTVKCGNPDIDFNKLYVFGISDMVFYSLGGGEVEKYTNAKGYTLVKPENPRTPIAPTLLYKNATSITLLHIDGYEYSIDGVNYQKSNVFDDLLPNSVYTFYQRIADDVYKASIASEGLMVSTTEMPSKPKIESITDNTVVIGAVDGYEYSFDLINWQSSNVFTNLEYDKKYSFYTRTASQDTIPCPTPSEPQEVVIASAPEIKLIGATQIVVKYIDGYEYSVDGIIWQSSNMFDKLIPDFEYTIYQRYAGCEFHSTGTQIITNGQDVNTNPSSEDLVSLKKELLSADEGNNLCYDYNADGEIDIRDLVRLKKFLAGVDVPLGSTENTETQTLELLSNPAYLEQKNTVV